jgi:hypothetical protein
MASQITQDQIIEINELYLQIGTYAGVSRVMGGRPAPSTVKKYIIPNYVSRENQKKTVFHKEEIPNLDSSLFEDIYNWGDLCTLTEEEREEIVCLWDEMLI